MKIYVYIYTQYIYIYTYIYIYLCVCFFVSHETKDAHMQTFTNTRAEVSARKRQRLQPSYVIWYLKGLNNLNLQYGLDPFAPTIGHSPQEDRRRHRNWIWRLGQLHDDTRSLSLGHKKTGLRSIQYMLEYLWSI